jgi:hypothetical protein
MRDRQAPSTRIDLNFKNLRNNTLSVQHLTNGSPTPYSHPPIGFRYCVLQAKNTHPSTAKQQLPTSNAA